MDTSKVRTCFTFSVALAVLILGGDGMTHAQPKSGDWRVPCDFGEFVFTVNPGGTEIPKLVITFSGWTCGGVTQSGTVTITRTPAWPISDGQFTLENSLFQGNVKITLHGTFNQAGDQASGTWSALVYGTTCSGSWGPVVLVSVEEVDGVTPDRFVLAQNFPNPFNSRTTIRFALPKTTRVSVKVYNPLGVEVATLVDEVLPSGQYRTEWNAADAASGVYLYRIQAGAFADTKKLVLLK